MRTIVAIGAFLGLLCLGCGAPRYSILHDLDAPLPAGESACVGDIVDALSADVPEKDRPSSEKIDKLRAQLARQLTSDKVFGSAGIAAGEPCAARYEVTGRVLVFKKGSGAARFFLGFGAGASQLTVNLTIADKTRNLELFSGNFSATVSGWQQSSDEVLTSIASDFTSAVKKSGTHK